MSDRQKENFKKVSTVFPYINKIWTPQNSILLVLNTNKHLKYCDQAPTWFSVAGWHIGEISIKLTVHVWEDTLSHQASGGSVFLEKATSGFMTRCSLRQHQVEVYHPSINSQSHADTLLGIPHDFQWMVQTFQWMTYSLFRKYVTDLIKKDRIPEPRCLIPLVMMMRVTVHSNTNMLKHRCGFEQSGTFS